MSYQGLRKSQLSANRQHLLVLMQRLSFGKLHDLHVRQGDPQFSPAPRVVQVLRFPGDNGPRIQTHLRDFVLKQQHTELLTQLDELSNGVISVLEVRDGLPAQLMIERAMT
jgi:hypothetical protein